MLVIADDLTGAVDAAGAFAAGGHHSVVVLHPQDTTGDMSSGGGVLVVDTDTRPMTGAQAFAITAGLVHRLAPDELFIKIDSTLRGHVRATVDGALSALAAAGAPPAHVVVCPAFPSQGRTVVGAQVHIGGVPINAPSLADVFAGLPTATLLAIPDALTDNDLATFVASATRSGRGSTLWVGSAGLARQLGMATASDNPSPLNDAHPPRAAERVLVVVGSRQARTAEQIDHLDPDTAVLIIDPRDPSLRDQLEPAVMQADGLVLTGGATARAVLDMLQVRTLVVHGEVEPGIPWATGSGRSGDITVVTKAGGFGDAFSLQGAVRFLARA
ncbi:unannotated protein [freshwater metagenome]|uniref:Unannotated protein n=1 Tax=freshwater metagenome TaxID=449393 RepID=A0A6J7EYA7_9ZZZZ